MIFVLFGFAATIALASHISHVKRECLLSIAEENSRKPLEICLIGAVKNPGIYQVEPGSTLKDLLKTVELSRRADRKKIRFKTVFHSSQTVSIPEKSPTLKRGLSS